MTDQRKHVLIVGAGIVGVSTALWLQRDGHRVTLIDKTGPAEGTSYGNAGLLARSSIVPVTGPGLIGKAPKMLLDPNQPLFLKWRYLPRLMPWLIKYLGHANAADTVRIADALFPIIGDSLADHQALAEGTPAAKWIVPTDYLFAYNDRAHYEGDAFGWSIRRKHGFAFEEMEHDALKAFDPILGDALTFGVRVPEHGRIADPGRYVKDLAAHVVAQGGRLVTAEVSDLVREQGRVSSVRIRSGSGSGSGSGEETLSGDAVVIALGAWSGPLTRKLGIDVPLETERGYHVELWEPSAMPRAPSMVASGKFIMTPMDGRIRLAGVVEFGGLEAAPSRAPFDLLRRSVKAALPGVTWASETEWMGHRPAPTDSIPIIGPVPGAPGAYLGFGHHHVGLTGGPKTGRLLAQLIAGRTPNMDMAPYAPERFAK